jgi:hypothetical protein
MVSAEDGQWDEATTWQRQAIAGAQRAGFSATAQHLMSTLPYASAARPAVPWSDDDNLSGWLA